MDFQTSRVTAHYTSHVSQRSTYLAVLGRFSFVADVGAAIAHPASSRHRLLATQAGFGTTPFPKGRRSPCERFGRSGSQKIGPSSFASQVRLRSAQAKILMARCDLHGGVSPHGATPRPFRDWAFEVGRACGGAAIDCLDNVCMRPLISLTS